MLVWTGSVAERLEAANRPWPGLAAGCRMERGGKKPVLCVVLLVMEGTLLTAQQGVGPYSEGAGSDLEPWAQNRDSLGQE